MAATVSFLLLVVIALWAVFWRNSSILHPTLARLREAGNKVCLTFDDGPDPEITPLVLDILREKGCRATFFCLGSLVDKYPEIVRRVAAEGHQLAGHGYTHDAFKVHFRGVAATEASIVKTGLAIQAAVGYFPAYYRAPIGIKSPSQALAGWRLGLVFVGWSLWPRDGGALHLTRRQASLLVRRARGGDIVLLHDGKLDWRGDELKEGKKSLALLALLPALLDGLRAKGLEMVTLAESGGPAKELSNPPATVADVPERGFKRQFHVIVEEFVHGESSPSELAWGLGLGAFIGCSPFLGAHCLLAIILAVKLKINKIAALVGTNVSMPFTAPLVVWICVKTGALFLGGDIPALSLDMFEKHPPGELAGRLFLYWLAGFPLVGAATAIAVVALSYPLFALCRRLPR